MPLAPRSTLHFFVMYYREPITADMLIWAYANGVFPMADSRGGHVQWYSADPRAILPLDRFHVSHSLRKRVRRGQYTIRFDTAFDEVIRRCAQPRRDEGDTWINDQIVDGYCRLYERGIAHSVEAWRRRAGEQESRRAGEPDSSLGIGHLSLVIEGEGGAEELVGGLYGVAMGGAFFGESMFSLATDASKVCLVHLIEHLRRRGYQLLDVQMNSRHMAQFGTIDIPRRQYMRRLKAALRLAATWE